MNQDFELPDLTKYFALGFSLVIKTSMLFSGFSYGLLEHTESFQSSEKSDAISKHTMCK